jgi:N-acylneuraminate cytidylyltransferase/CMP-N,N'-diacetyllegionaminic acid synthase
MGFAMKRLCTICARGGSKGVKGKNIRPLLGKPLIAYSIEQAKKSGLFDVVAVSSDSDPILDVSRQFGADYAIKRPDELATDSAAKLPAIRHCALEAERLSGLSFQTYVDLDSTSPLRSIDDIANAVALLEGSDSGNVITAMPSRRSPYFNIVEEDGNGIVSLSKPLEIPVVRRQDAPKCYDMNASIYVWRRACLFSDVPIINSTTKLYVMPEERSIDIDSEVDFQLVELLMGRGKVLP